MQSISRQMLCLASPALAIWAAGLFAASPTFAGAPASSSAQASDTVAVGEPAPGFTLPDQDGRPVGPKDFAGRWVVLYFYPKDFTGGCSLEARNFQLDSAAYSAAGAVILGVSTDPPATHKRFCIREGLGFRLLADTAGTVSARYGSLGNFLGIRLSKRDTFIIDPKGRVARIFRGVKPSAHSREVLAALTELGAR